MTDKAKTAAIRSAWLIEREGNHETEYIGDDHYQWTNDVQRAIKFVTKRDAEICAHVQKLDVFQVEEHSWPDGW